MAYNEPAFPSGESYVTTDFAGNQTTHRKGPLYQGITKREYFAAMAMQALIPVWQEQNQSFDLIKRSVNIADSMIKALQE